MNIHYQVEQFIETIEERAPIFVADFKVDKKWENARNIAFHRLEEHGVIKKFKKGVYYKPKKTPFGELGLDLDEFIKKKYLINNETIKGYLTGPILWNNWGITTQVPNRKWIVTNEIKSNCEDDILQIKLIKPKEKVKIDQNNYKALQYLDVISQIEEIQDINQNTITEVLVGQLEKFNTQELAYIIEYMVYYKKLVQKLTGALIEYRYQNTPQYNEIKCFINIRKNDLKRSKVNKIKCNYIKLKNIKEWGLN